MTSLADVPFETQYNAAIGLVGRGELEPHEALWALIFGGDAPIQLTGERARKYEGSCKRGHPRNEENTRFRRDGRTYCRVCEKARHERRKTPLQRATSR